jgi:predicted transcriptional regulator
MMSGLGERLQEQVDELKRLRDELRVQAELAKMEARDLWETSEKRWDDLESNLERLGREAHEPLEKVGEAVKQLVHEIGEAYKEIRKLV